MPPITAFAFVDDSGDIGTRSSSKQNHFSLGGFFSLPSDDHALADCLAQMRLDCGFGSKQELHFSNYVSKHRTTLATAVASAPIQAFSAVLCKRAGPEKRPWRSEHLYNWMIKLVLERASWYFQGAGLHGSITFAHLKGSRPKRAHDYVRLLQERTTSIKWDSLHLPIRFSTPGVDERLQIADIITSATGQAFEGPGEGRPTDQTYWQILHPCLWRRYGKLKTYGLKVQPPVNVDPPCRQDSGHAWVAPFFAPT